MVRADNVNYIISPSLHRLQVESSVAFWTNDFPKSPPLTPAPLHILIQPTASYRVQGWEICPGTRIQILGSNSLTVTDSVHPPFLIPCKRPSPSQELTKSRSRNQTCCLFTEPPMMVAVIRGSGSYRHLHLGNLRGDEAEQCVGYTGLKFAAQ